MAKIRNPFLSLGAKGSLGKLLTIRKRQGQHIAESKPIPTDAKSPNQLIWRHMYQKAVDLWHQLSAEEKAEWESLARPRHMTGYAWFISQALRPNPGIYLPLQGGTMQGNIDMAKHRLLKLPAPTTNQEPVTKKYFEDNLPPGGYTEGARVYHNADQSIPHTTITTLAFNSERWDTDNIHDPVTNNSRLTCKTAGKYQVAGHIIWATDSSGYRRIRIVLNDITIVVEQYDAVVTNYHYLVVLTILDLAVDDYIEIRVAQGSGADLSVIYDDYLSPEFMMQRIG